MGYFVAGGFCHGGFCRWGILSLGDFVMGAFVTGDFGMVDFDPVPLFLYELCIKEKDFAAFMVTCFQMLFGQSRAHYYLKLPENQNINIVKTCLPLQ